MRLALAFFGLLLVAGTDAGFWTYWGDGQAELSSYDLVEPHYGQPRRGVAILIFVTETFSNSLRVKADPGKHPKSDEFPVMKLNLMKDFQTGIYDYHDMTSSFLALEAVNGRPAGSLTKVSFSSQEWCGHVYHELWFDSHAIRSTRHSYFDGEADERTDLKYPAGGISEDALFFWARGIAQPEVKPGQSRTVSLLRSLQGARDRHAPVGWSPATLSRSPNARQISVPAGKFQSEVWTAKSADVTWTFYVERAGPNRILKWETSTGEKAELLATERLKYWQMNQPGGEEALKKLRLSPRPPRTT
jgi:hypothetical protein